MVFNTSKMTITAKHDYESEKCKLLVYGFKWNDIPNKDIIIDCIEARFVKKLNFDGGFFVYYKNKERGIEIVFKGNADLFLVFWIKKEGTIWFSDDFYSLIPLANQLSYDLHSISDYFDNSWNSLIKRGRSPINEIKSLDNCCYGYIGRNEEFLIDNLGKCKNQIVYKRNNLKCFKKEFINTISYYLEKIKDEYRGCATYEEQEWFCSCV